MAVARAVTSDAAPSISTTTEAATPAVTDAPTRWYRHRAWRRLWSLAQAVLLLAASAGIWFVCVPLYERHNDFPSSYHPDEPSKGAQLVEDDRNFRHPMLMLETARLLSPGPPSSPPVTDPIELAVRQGRRVSAGYAAGAAILLAWAGFAAAGWAGFAAVGVAVGLCPALLAHAHFFKEDATLVFGVASVLCCGAWMLRVRSAGAKLWLLIGLGVACGLAAAGKYCGAIMLAPAVGIGLVAARRHWGLMAAVPLIVIVFAAVTWLAIDYRALLDWNSFVQSLQSEETHSTTEHQGLALARPTGFFVDRVWTEAMPHVKTLIVLAVPALAWQIRRRQRWAFAVWLALTAVVYSAMLAYSVIPFYRYALPVTVMLYALAGLIAAYLAIAFPRPWMRLAAAATFVAVIGTFQGVRCADYLDQFADDSRDALRKWADTLPPGTTVAADGYTELEGSRLAAFFGSRARVMRYTYIADAARTPQDLAARGVRYVVTASTSSERFLSPYVQGAPGDTGPFERRRAFYAAVLKLPVVWSRVAKHSTWTFANPDIVVYRLDVPARK